MESKMNVVLVHGAWADGSSWSKVIPLLQAEGCSVTAVQLPLSSLEDDIAATRRVLDMQEGPTILVGHSYGGAVISEAANHAPDVKALVYIAGFALEEGESIEALGKQGTPTPGAAHIHLDKYGYLWIDPKGYTQFFVPDTDPTAAAVMAATQGPLSLRSFTAKSGPPAWKHLPSYYLVSLNDQIIPPAAEELMAKRMGANVRTVPASHASMVSHPQEVAEIITQAVESIAGVAVETIAV